MRKHLDKTGNEFKTYSDVFDEFTLRNLFRLESQGYFRKDSMSPLFIGKESNVFTALNKEGKKVVIKIYRLSTCDFNKMYSYLKRDPRYTGVKKQRRKVIFSWAQREYRNLLKAREANVNVPLPLTCMHNILVLEMIGKEFASSKVKDSKPDDAKAFFDEVIKNMKKLYRAGLVHGDLSSFNILNFEETPVLIDFSQGTTTKNSDADELLDRDVRNVCNYFIKLGVKIDKEKIKASILKAGL